ncbi:long-chain-fatty-acid--CoA ligase ACSBG2 isoform X2 [Erinaceus europaeus]|uniref:Long-chain-fatty-acid--CoA ligase ACSBG2 n=1 Tax=Erinaceus europaeus TaxID=9365 RepID=A0ABM3WLQ5_ERIEU|nr:long-chain-fatty-acid--CoA ligase ACSBG2 isoform X2 [Erinaceus europaeus]XP_060037507.1 long-chain-fatty-acid--CoA ligase ACSBG2 isoform X2 [Erinaceus europaeus]
MPRRQDPWWGPDLNLGLNSEAAYTYKGIHSRTRPETPGPPAGKLERLEIEESDSKVEHRPWVTHADEEVIIRMSKHGPGHEAPITIPDLFRESVLRFGSYSALASKTRNKWDVLNFNQYYTFCRRAAKALIKLGLERFHGVGILGINSVEWIIACMGSILAGGLCVGIYATNTADACHFVITQAKVDVLLVENDQQLQKILSIPHGGKEMLKAIVQYRAPIKQSWENLYSWKDFLELGSHISDSQLDQLMESQKANQCAVLIYTAGTTGNPKGVMLSHDNITWTAGAVAKDLGLHMAAEKQEVVVSYLPLSHIAAQIMDVWIPLKIGAFTYCAPPDALRGTLLSTLQEVKPTAFLGVPRIWEKMQEKVKESCGKSSSLKKKVFSWAQNVGRKMSTRRLLGFHEVPMNYRMAKALVFSKVRQSLGLEHCQLFISGTVALSHETTEFFLSLDMPICEVYGLSESSGPHTACTPNNYRPLSCGKSLSGCKTLLYQQNNEGVGEVCLWGRHVFMGYLDKAEATQDTLDEDGWLHSGDLGCMDHQGFLYITGRIKEMLITSSGENVSPVPIENKVKERLPIINHAVLVGHREKFLSILLTLKCEVDKLSGEPTNKLSLEAVTFCQKLGSQATTVSEIVEFHDPLVYNTIQEAINAVNQEAVSTAQRIQKWVILDKDFSIYGGELGPTSKIKRQFIAQKYKDQIENFYH